jgi:ketosteroid isomerase-like protein
MEDERVDDREEIIRLEHELFGAFLRGDAGPLAEILDDRFTFTDPHGPPMSKAKWLSDLVAGKLKFESVEIEEIKVTLIGDTGLANGRVNISSAPAGYYNGRYHYTDVYVKNQGRWKAILSTAQVTKV